MFMEAWLKMKTTQITELNVITGEIIEREFNAAEKIAHDLLKQEAEIIAAADAEKEAARQAILDRLGLTAEELKTILG
jgi:serine/threonine protein kinase HipA of HipAB toxin-antitoxin module